MGRPTYWTESRIREAAIGYEFKIDFSIDFSGAYGSAKRKYPWLLNELFPVFKKLVWTEEALYAEASKYQTRNEFRVNALGAYSRACDTGILDDICEHMINSRIKQGRFDLGKYENLTGIYFLYNEDEVVYVGKSTKCMVGRVRDHYKSKSFDTVVLHCIENIADLHLAECYYITKMKPIYNDEFSSNYTLTLDIDTIDDIVTESFIVTASFGVNGMNSYKGK